MVAAMAAFALEDMFLKSAAWEVPVGQILMLFGTGGTLGFLILARIRGERVFTRALLSRGIALRAALESTARLCYTLAIALTPLSSASAILQATPLVVVAGAALLLGERVAWSRWLAILAGFGGVLMILRPGPGSFEAASLFAVFGMLGFAGRDLTTRVMPRGLSNATLGFCGFVVLIPTGALFLAATGGAVWPSASSWAALAAGTLFGIVAYAALTAAMRTGEVSVVTPFRYSRLLFGVTLGVLVFGERPDTATLLGSAVILGSGLFIMLGRRKTAPVQRASGGRSA
ncbi:EamA-like transporter family protein [Aliiruegeria haliotis]|uniref:EamA-like transporter family protein n=2 Tax=Aliiruegeria haliotis TaxID=1280846 RepID=A0A2T0RRG7_9RHOB|nr:EamA-like transporter family protein [Aliiruegeria haliotis]